MWVWRRSPHFLTQVNHQKPYLYCCRTIVEPMQYWLFFDHIMKMCECLQELNSLKVTTVTSVKNEG